MVILGLEFRFLLGVNFWGSVSFGFWILVWVRIESSCADFRMGGFRFLIRV